MKRFRRWFRNLSLFLGIAFVAAIVLLSGFYFWNKKAIEDFAPSLSAFYAKSFCSCFFISERSINECHEYARQYIPIESFHLDEKISLVHVKALGKEARVFYVNEKEGCSLEPLR